MRERIVTDHLERTVRYPFPPKRIVSLCPSITETLFELGLVGRIVGRTRYCIHPKELVVDVKTVGGTKKVKENVIDEIQPDLIIAEKEENPREVVESLSRNYPVFTTEVRTYKEAIAMIKDLGNLTDRTKRAGEVIHLIEEKFEAVGDGQKCRVAYVIWQNPFMVAGNDTYIHSMLEKAGFENVFADLPDRYPSISLEDFRSAAPDAILLASEPFPFQETHCQALQEKIPETKVMRVNGEICWYGSRMMKAADELIRLRKVL